MFLIASQVVGAEEKNSMPELYFLAVNSSSIRTVILLNDVPLVDLKDGSSVVHETPVAGWLMPGTNSLKIRAWAAPEMETITGNVSASIYLHDPASEVPKPLKILAQAAYPNEDSDTKRKQHSLEVIFDYEAGTPARLWREAQTIASITERDRLEMLSLVDGLGDAITNGDIDKAIEYQKFKIQDDALLEGDSVKEIEMAVSANYTWLQGQQGLELRNYDPEGIQYLEMADHKVIKLVQDSGDEILQFESSDLFFEMPVYVSKINGAWKIVR